MPQTLIRSRSSALCTAALTLIILAGTPLSPALAQSSGGAASTSAGAFRVEDAEHLREELRMMVIAARDRVFPALVNVNTITVSYWNGKQQKGQSVGSGTIISKEGHVLTNQHVVDQGQTFRITLADKTEVSATLVGEDVLTDLAVLKINLDELKGRELPVAALGDSNKVGVGDTVLAMGSPFALSRSVTLGIVSNTERVFATSFKGDDSIDEMQEERGERSGLFTQWIQHDAAINPGNSGGPLVNLAGEVVGVNTRGGTNMGFASPSNLAKEVAEKLKQFGEVPRSWVGFTLRPLQGTLYTEGVLVTSVIADGPAGKAGVKAGDLITAIDGQPLTVRFPELIPPLLKQLADRPIGGTIALDLKRGSETIKATVTTDRFLPDRGDETALRAWGLSIREITPKIQRDMRLDSREGVLVGSVRSGGPAGIAEPSLNWGDVIKAIDNQPIKSMAELVDSYKSIMASDPIPEFVMITYERRGTSNVTLIKPRPEDRTDPARELPKAWFGVVTQPVLRDLAKKLGHEGKQGFRVTRIYSRTTAAESGIKIGDVIVGINGEALTPRGPQDAGLLQRRVRQMKIDEEITLSVLRDAQPAEVKVKLERTRIGPEEARRRENKDFELTVRELTFFDRDAERWDDTVQGVMVDSADQGGWAGLAGLGSGDLIQQAHGLPIKTLDDFTKVMDQLAKEQPAKVEFVVLRDNRTFFKFAEPAWKPSAGKEEKPTAETAPKTP